MEKKQYFDAVTGEKLTMVSGWKKKFFIEYADFTDESGELVSLTRNEVAGY